ncbi:MAG: hypothetical protein ABR571_13730 [Jatrophihabitans sp.]|uniref:hypothetical protein n=1 Tax=Jatrophihabitans sp. TaxID=1932789 RepID=UPI0039164D9F
MISNTLVRRAVQLEYSLLRTPLAVVKRNLTSRLSKDSKVRVGVERGLGTLDAVAGQLLSPPSTDRPSGSGDERTKSRAAADVPADGNVEPTHDEVELSHDDEVARVVVEIREELEQKPVTGELADPELQEVQAELRAKHLVEEYEEEQRIKREHEERVRAAEAARKAPARKSTATKAVAHPAKTAAAKKTPGAR